MKIQAVMAMRWNGDTPEAVILDAAHNLAEYNFFQRGRCGAARTAAPPPPPPRTNERRADAARARSRPPPHRERSVKEFLNFAAKTVMRRIGPGVQVVDYEGAWKG